MFTAAASVVSTVNMMREEASSSSVHTSIDISHLNGVIKKTKKQCLWPHLYKLVDSVKVIVGSCSLLRNQALLKGGEAAVNIFLQTRLQIK